MDASIIVSFGSAYCFSLMVFPTWRSNLLHSSWLWVSSFTQQLFIFWEAPAPVYAYCTECTAL